MSHYLYFPQGTLMLKIQMNTYKAFQPVLPTYGIIWSALPLNGPHCPDGITKCIYKVLHAK